MTSPCIASGQTLPSARQGARSCAGTRRRESGGVLAEFAILALIFWLLLAGILELGRAFAAQQVLQHAARTIARELAELEIRHDADFREALDQVVDPGFLVIDDRLLARCGLSLDRGDLDTLFESLPRGNQMLRPLMIADRFGTVDMIRFPGALLRRTGVAISAASDCTEGSAFTVGIPQLVGSSAVWRAVVEPERGPGATVAERDSFSLARGGWAGVRINYPFQSAAMLPWRETGVLNPRTGQSYVELEAYVPDAQISDVGLAELDAVRAAGWDQVAPVPGQLRAYSGELGLGTLYAGTGSDGQPRAVRPYRRLLSATAGFRRELYLP